MDYNKQSRVALLELCKARGIKGCSGKKKEELVALLSATTAPEVTDTISHVPVATTQVALSLFSGAGGDTLGLTRAGWKVTHFSEFNEPATRTHTTVFPDSSLLTGKGGSSNITEIPDATFSALKGKVDLIFAGHPCFTAGTRVLTQEGYKAIETVTLEDKLLTHTGAFQPIVNLQRRPYDGPLIHVTSSFHTKPIQCTPTHPFYARKGADPLSWVAAEDLTVEHKLVSIRAVCDPELISKHGGEEMGIYALFGIQKLEIVQTALPITVYNFEVATDNSYVVENTVVHNCQGFSHAGKKRADDPRNELVHEFVRATRLVKPRWIIGENVKGLLSRKGVYPADTPARPVIEIIRDLFEAEGYKITYRVINATEVGVPQLRNRLIYVGHRGDTYPHLPWERLPTPPARPSIRALLTPTLDGAMEFPAHFNPATADARFWIPTTETVATGTPHPNLVRLVGGIRNLSTKEKEELGHTGKGAVRHVEPKGLISFGVRKSPQHGQILDPDAPSKTIICAYTVCPRLFVGLHNATTGKYWIRCLTPEECGGIQGFPSDFAWQGTRAQKITQIGNAVPPPLATAVANLLPHATFHATPQDAKGVAKGSGADTDTEEEDE